MPSELMDSHGSELNETQIGFWKTDDNSGVKDGKVYAVGGTSLASLPLDKQMLKHFGAPNLYLKNQDHFTSENNTLQIPLDNNNRPSFGMDHKSYLTAGNNNYENGLFSSSLSDLFSRKLRLSANNNSMYGHSVGASQYAEEEPFESLQEIEAHTIGNLLPDDDDLLSGVTDGLKGSGDDVEELDFFSSVGGMELGEDAGQTNYEISGLQPHPSRTLFVRNINSNVEDSELRILFEQYGEIHTLYTACKHRGFVMISYYDIRAARRAMQALQNKPLRRRKLDIHYSIPKDNHSDKAGTVVIYNLDSTISNDELCHVFGVYGEVKEIREGSRHKSIEFYDIRAAETALRELNMAGKQLNSASKRPIPELDLDETLRPPADFTRDISGNVRDHGSRLSVGMGIPANMESSLKYDFPNYHPHSLPDGLTINGRMSERVQFNRLNNDNVFGPSSCSPHHYMWNPPPQPQPQPQPQPHNMMWPPSLMNGVGGNALANTFLHINNHHVGSAPSVWDRRESPDTFHIGNMRGFPPRNSHHQNSVMFPGRGGGGGGQMVIPTFDSPSRSRNHQAADNKKQFELDLDRIMRGEDRRTTLMIKNIPNKYTSKMLLAAIDERHRGTYDFIYLPIDFKNKCNVGYAFINMTEPSLIVPFYQAFNGKKWEKFNSEKVASIAYGRIQGKAALIAHFQNSSLMNEDKRCRPILFHTDGPNAGDQVPFPMGVNVRSRVNKNRNEDGSQSSNSSSGSTKDFE